MENIVAFNLGDQVDWIGVSSRKYDDWHGFVMDDLADQGYEILWTRSNCTKSSLRERSDVPFAFNYRTHESEEDLTVCTGGSESRHPKTNEWGNRYGIPGN